MPQPDTISTKTSDVGKGVMVVVGVVVGFGVVLVR